MSEQGAGQEEGRVGVIPGGLEDLLFRPREGVGADLETERDRKSSRHLENGHGKIPVMWKSGRISGKVFYPPRFKLSNAGRLTSSIFPQTLHPLSRPQPDFKGLQPFSS